MEALEHILNNKQGLVLPDTVLTLLNERKSNWYYAFKLRNNTNQTVRVVILRGKYNTSRLAQVTDSTYQAIGGGRVSYSGADNILLLYDKPDLINLQTGLAAHCVATTTLDGRKQTIFALSDTENVTVENLVTYSTIDFLTDFVAIYPMRVFQIQISSNSVEQFSQKISVKLTNPASAPKSLEIPIEDYFKPLQNQNKVIIDQPLQVGADTVLAMDFPAQAETTVTLKFSAMLNSRKELDLMSDINTIIQKLKNLK